MSEISLTASMRSNLLSLQQISKLQDSTQLRLSTGLKVNSAIDNPSSYYTASSLNNRAEDLSALLDSMGQSVQTIKAATEGIEKAEDLLSQMKAIAEQVNTGVYVPEKSYFEEKVGANGAVVTNAEELRAAVDNGKEEICVYGKIDLGDISTAGGLELQENQKLVGVNYYGNFGTEGEEFSSISATSSAADKNLIYAKKNGCLVSDLNLSYSHTGNAEGYAIRARDNNISLDIQNLNITAHFEGGGYKGIISTYGNAEINIHKNIEINSSGSNNGIFAFTNSTIRICSDANVNMSSLAQGGYNLYAYSNATIELSEGSTVKIASSGNTTGIYLLNKSQINIMGNLEIQTNNRSGISLNRRGQVNIASSANILFKTTNTIFNSGRDLGSEPNLLQIAQGAKIAVEKDGNTKWYEVKEDYRDENTSITTDNNITADNIEATLNVASTSAWKTAGDVVAELEQEKAEQEAKEAKEQANREVYQKQFNNALSQYDSLIKDSSYKGVNLLQADDLKVIFNENRSSTLEVSGVDLSSDKIGMMSANWSKAKDVQNSINQIINAKNTLRSASTKLGNYYSIITERETFTDNLINVLEEGADKLTLADMNEESANMLSLQTQQQLAINSLSLASQASQAVLRLF